MREACEDGRGEVPALAGSGRRGRRCAEGDRRGLVGPGGPGRAVPARELEQDGSGAWVEVDHGLGQVGELASDCFGPMLAVGPVAASRRVETAAALASRLPSTLAAMSTGDLDSWRATIIATELGQASRQSCAAVEAQIFPQVLDEAPGAVTKRVRPVLARIDADALRLKAAKERLDRFVHAYPSPCLAAMGFEIPGILDKFDTRITRVLLDEHTGVVIETGINTYLPNKAMRAFIHRRDGHGRFPGCPRNAQRCERDHVIPYLVALCNTTTGSNTTPPRN